METKLGRAQRYVWNRERGKAKRPWRLWGATAGGKGGNIPYRSFGVEVNAHNAALIDVRWGALKTIQVYDVVTGNESGTYTLRANGDISFSAPETSNIVKLLRKKGVI